MSEPAIEQWQENGRWHLKVTVKDPDGIRSVQMRRLEKHGPFDRVDIERMLNVRRVVQAGEKRRAWRFVLPRVGRTLFIHINTGPPTWWAPRCFIDREGGTSALVVGWLRGLIAVSLTRTKESP